MSDKKYKTVITALIALLFGLAIIFLFRDNSTISELNGLRIDYSMLETAYSNLKDENAELKVENEALKLQAQQQEESASSSTASSAISISTDDYRSDLTYSQIARTPDDYMGERLTLSGTVVQVLEDSGVTVLRVAVDGDYDNIILAYYNSELLSSRILTKDVIKIYGVSEGLQTYTSTLGQTITIPKVQVESIEQQ